MSGLAVFGFKIPSLLQFEKDKDAEPWLRRNLRTLYNDANHNYRVNVLEYWETKKDGRKQYFSWVTKLALTPENVSQVMRAGRISMENRE